MLITTAYVCPNCKANMTAFLKVNKPKRWKCFNCGKIYEEPNDDLKEIKET